MQLKVTAIFENNSKAEDAQTYLVGNGFTDGSAIEAEAGEPVPHNTAVLNGSSLTIYSETPREAQEALDVLNNYGALNVDILELH